MSKLTDVKLRTLVAPGKHFDGGGLYLEVTAAGGRYWRLKYRHGGKEKRLAFGVYPDVSLKAARERRDEARAILARGLDPAAERRAAEAKAEREQAVTFESVAHEWLAHQSGRWTAGTLELIRRSLESKVFPAIGSRPMAHLKARDMLPVVRAIEDEGKGETAGRVLQRVKAVFRYAVVHERIDSNPMLDLKPSELLKPRQVRHRAALADKDLPAFLAMLDAYEGDPTVKAALRLLMLTVVRPGELRLANWSEFDLGASTWRVPAERMKMRREHVVPLSRQALELLKAQRLVTAGAELVFPSPFYPGKPMSENTMNSALARMGYRGEHTAHGFRALFSTVANEAGKDPDVIERQLAHAERNEVRAAYHRAQYLADRAELLQWWADHLDGRQGGRVVQLRSKVPA